MFSRVGRELDIDFYQNFNQLATKNTTKGSGITGGTLLTYKEDHKLKRNTDKTTAQRDHDKAMQNEREASAVIVFPSEQDQLTWVETQRGSLHRATRLSEN